MRKLIALGCLSYLVIGLAHVVGGSVMEQMLDKYDLSYDDGGQWMMNQFFGFLVGVLLSPYITSKIGKRGGVLVSLGLLTLGEAAYSLTPHSWGLMLFIALFAGFGFGMTESVIGAMVIDMAEENGKANAMTKLETFFGIGAFLMPTLAGILIRYDVWQLSFPILSALAGITFILWMTLSFGPIDDKIGYHARVRKEHAESKPTIAGAKGFFGYKASAIPFLLLSALFFLIYVGVEMSFSNYLPSIMIARSGMTEASAPSSLSLFWATMIVGRLFAGRLADRVGYFRYLLVAIAGACLVVVAMGAVLQLSGMMVLIALSGLFFSGVFGIALVFANGLLPGTTERTTSLLVACGGIGGAIFPKLTGWMMDSYGADRTVWILGALIVVMFIVLIAMLALGRRQQAEAATAS
ncbi:MFS transporter [Paenibacillus glycanilyticus]|uniref:Glucose/mannose:H+ symporter GlcP n=1 Tax=Paenibacillus glycanilyticus TaxID=126569 RepID=A0ABQ6GM84_9BACL|nr:MFS transporter [Paenibacillus glycanilyticus]GLX71360.1 putative glucose/mannose:H+ symporter GlcP [Paenibacillus glycanilyticus]